MMSYDVFISYEISDSSLAYDLAAALSRNGVTYYLDCVNSSVTLSDYVKLLFKDSRLFIPLVSAHYLQEGYAHNLLSYSVGIGKQVLVCNTDGCALPVEMGWGIPDKNKIDVRNCDIESVAQDGILRLLNQTEGEGTVGLQDFSATSVVEDVPVVDSELDPFLIEEEKKRLLAEILYALRVHKELEDGVVRYVKPEPSKTLFEKEKKEKTFKEKVMDVILFPYYFILGIFFMFLAALIKLPVITIALIFCIVKCSNADEPKKSSVSHGHQFTKEQIEEGRQLAKVGSDYYYGRNGIEEDWGKSLEYYQAAAELDNTMAIYNLGMCAKLGHGCVQSLDVASWYFFRAAKLGYEQGFEQLKVIAESGVASAQNRYGLCFEYGYCTKVIDENAAYWYFQSARQGERVAQYNIGLCYYYGRGVRKNTQEALKWFKMSAQQGYENAAKKVSEIEGK